VAQSFNSFFRAGKSNMPRPVRTTVCRWHEQVNAYRIEKDEYTIFKDSEDAA
jgi:hypothetical protein